MILSDCWGGYEKRGGIGRSIFFGLQLALRGNEKGLLFFLGGARAFIFLSATVLLLPATVVGLRRRGEAVLCLPAARGRSGGLPEAVHRPLCVPARLSRVEERALVRCEKLARDRIHALVGPALRADVHRRGARAARGLVADAGVEARTETAVLLDLLAALEVAARLDGDLLLNDFLVVGRDRGSRGLLALWPGLRVLERLCRLRGHELIAEERPPVTVCEEARLLCEALLLCRRGRGAGHAEEGAGVWQRRAVVALAVLGVGCDPVASPVAAVYNAQLAAGVDLALDFSVLSALERGGLVAVVAV